MGGNIAAHVAVRLGKELDGLVLGSPMVSVEKLKKNALMQFYYLFPVVLVNVGLH